MPRIIRFHRTGGPEVLQIDDLPAQSPGPGELRLTVHALGLNRAEAMFRAGQYLEAPILPARLGYEAAGVVDAIGPGVTGFAVGDTVSTIPAFSMNTNGVYGEQAVVPAQAVVKHSANLDAVHAAALWMQYLTAWGALIDIAELGQGDSVLIPAATSSVGLAAIQIARAVGARPIALTRTRAKSAALLAAAPGIDMVFTEEENIADAVSRLVGPAPPRIAFDPVAGPTVTKLAESLAPGGTLFLYGALSPDPTPFPLFAALGKGLMLRGYTLFEITSHPARLEAGVAFVMDGLHSGKLSPVIARVFPFEEIVQAHRYLESNAQIGKIIVTVP